MFTNAKKLPGRCRDVGLVGSYKCGMIRFNGSVCRCRNHSKLNYGLFVLLIYILFENWWGNYCLMIHYAWGNCILVQRLKAPLWSVVSVDGIWIVVGLEYDYESLGVDHIMLPLLDWDLLLFLTFVVNSCIFLYL